MNKELLQKENFLPNVGDLIVTKIHFGKKDGSLTQWVQSIPRGRFSIIIKDAIRAYIHGNTEYKLPTYSPIKNPKESVLKSLSIGKGDYDIYTYLYSIEKYMRASHIKAVLSHFLNGAPIQVPLSASFSLKQNISLPAPEKNRKQTKESVDRANKNKIKLLQIAKMMDSEMYEQH